MKSRVLFDNNEIFFDLLKGFTPLIPLLCVVEKPTIHFFIIYFCIASIFFFIPTLIFYFFPIIEIDNDYIICKFLLYQKKIKLDSIIAMTVNNALYNKTVFCKSKKNIVLYFKDSLKPIFLSIDKEENLLVFLREKNIEEHKDEKVFYKSNKKIVVLSIFFFLFAADVLYLLIGYTNLRFNYLLVFGNVILIIGLTLVSIGKSENT